VVVRFSSDIRDTQHGNGMMFIDQASSHVVKLTYTPNQLPPHATSGVVTEFSGQAMPNMWYVTRIVGLYSGRAFFMRGTGRFTGTFDHFERFDTIGLANAALENSAMKR